MKDNKCETSPTNPLTQLRNGWTFYEAHFAYTGGWEEQ